MGGVDFRPARTREPPENSAPVRVPAAGGPRDGGWGGRYAERLDIELKDELVAEFLAASINTNLIWTKDSRRETSTNCS